MTNLNLQQRLTQNQRQLIPILDVAVGEGVSILKLRDIKRQSLPICWHALLVLDLGLHLLDGVSCLHVKRDGLITKHFQKDLRAHQTKAKQSTEFVGLKMFERFMYIREINSIHNTNEIKS